MMRPGFATAAAAVFAAGWQYACGLARFHVELNYAYAAGHEILLGRLPYRDIQTWAGPVLFLMQAAFFKIFGLSYAGGYLAHAAALNVAATAIIAAAAWRRTKNPGAVAAGAFLTAIWFYPIFTAHPWYDQESFFFLIAAVGLLSGSERPAAAAAAGLLAALSFFTKQSNGGLGVALIGLALLQARGGRAALAFWAGAAAGGALLAGLSVSWGGIDAFVDSFLIAPLKAERAGFARRPMFWALGLAWSALALFAASGLRWLAVPLGLCAAAIALTSGQFLIFFAPLVLLAFLKDPFDRAMLLALALLQAGGRLTSNNEIKVFWPFLGLFCAWAVAAAQERGEEGWIPGALWRDWLWCLVLCLAAVGMRLSYWHSVKSFAPVATFIVAAGLAAACACALRRARPILGVVLLLAAIGLGLKGARVSWLRRSQPAFAAELQRSLPLARLDHPQLKGVSMRRADAEGLQQLLSHLGALPPERKAFLAYYECEILYPLMRQPMPQPLLWFDSTATYKKGDPTEERIVRRLRAARVRTVVLCGAEHFEALPRLQSWLELGTLELEAGAFKVYAVGEGPA